MHAFTAPSGNTYFHNGDFSGDIRALVDSDKVETCRAMSRVEIPFEDIVALVHKYQELLSEQAMEAAQDQDHPNGPAKMLEGETVGQYALRITGGHRDLSAEEWDEVRRTGRMNSVAPE